MVDEHEILVVKRDGVLVRHIVAHITVVTIEFRYVETALNMLNLHGIALQSISSIVQNLGILRTRCLVANHLHEEVIAVGHDTL